MINNEDAHLASQDGQGAKEVFKTMQFISDFPNVAAKTSEDATEWS